jgi:excisionase family DNA binding protein
MSEPRDRCATRIPRFSSIPEVAGVLGCCTKTVRRLISAGELPAHRFGRQLRVSEPDLLAFIARTRCP